MLVDGPRKLIAASSSAVTASPPIFSPLGLAKRAAARNDLARHKAPSTRGLAG